MEKLVVLDDAKMVKFFLGNGKLLKKVKNFSILFFFFLISLYVFWSNEFNKLITNLQTVSADLHLHLQ